MTESLTFTCPVAKIAGIKKANIRSKRNNFLMVQQNNEKKARMVCKWSQLIEN